MKYLTVILILLSLQSFSQDTSFTRTYTCNCDTTVQSIAFPLNGLQKFMKEKGVNCDFKKNGIESIDYENITRRNTDKATVDKYPNIKLRFKLSVLCNENGLRVQMAYQEGRPGTTRWINTLTEKGEEYAADVFEAWRLELLKKVCKP